MSGASCWLVTLFGINTLAVVAVVQLYRGAPDVMQRGAHAWLGIALTFIASGFLLALLTPQRGDAQELIEFGLVLEHLGVLVLVFRLWFKEQERRCLQTPSQPSLHSHR